MTRYFIDQELTQIITLTENTDSFHHLVNVLRYKVNQQIVFVNEVAKIYQLTEVLDDQLIFTYLNDEKINPELTTNVDILLPFLKKNNFELILQKNTELGASDFYLANMQNSVVKVDQKGFTKKQGRYLDITKNAAMQSQRNKLPNVSGVYNIKNFDYSKYDLIICCYETRREDNIMSIYKDIKQANNILIITGPEGGFNVEEIQYLKQIPTLKIVTLGNRILRAETASISCMSLVSQLIES